MTRKQTRLVGHNEHLFPDAFYQLIPIPTGEICAPDRAREDKIAAETNIRCRNIKNAVPKRMSRREADFKLHAAEAQDLPLVEINRRFGSGVNIKSKHPAASTGPP